MVIVDSLIFFTAIEEVVRDVDELLEVEAVPVRDGPGEAVVLEEEGFESGKVVEGGGDGTRDVVEGQI